MNSGWDRITEIAIILIIVLMVGCLIEMKVIAYCIGWVALSLAITILAVVGWAVNRRKK